MSMSMLEFMNLMASKPTMTKIKFGVMVHSDDEGEREEALKALEEAGGYDNLED